MADIVWKGSYAGEIGKREKLSLDRIATWLLSRKMSQSIVQVAADEDLPLRIVMQVGEHEVEVMEVWVRQESEESAH